LALLAACLEDRPVYVLDEWASNQDPRFKRFFYLEVLPELRSRGKSVLVISHDEEYFHVADRVVRLESGRLVADEPESLASDACLAGPEIEAAP
jgi:putative ATP-binding cassette transporter